jgi:D-psicose/D-tagatose/L-ribulose 3-epimerase
MRIGANTLIWTAGFEREHLPLVAEIRAHGFDLVELARFDWTGFPAVEVRRALADNGLGVTCCSAFVTPELNLAGNGAAAAEFMKRAVDATAEVGATTLVGPFYTPVGYKPGRRATGDEWSRVVAGLRAAGEYAAKAGVTIAVEPLNRFETYFLNTAAQAARLCDAVGLDNVGILYDTFHAHIEEKGQCEAIRAAGRRIKHVHSCENDRGIPGSGQVQWEGVFGGLREVGYDGALVIESFGYAIKELAAAACIWRDLAGSPAEIAWRGAEFLRRSI